MSLGILTSTLAALKNIPNHPAVTYIGLNLAGMIKYTNDSSHHGKRKSRFQLVRISAAVCGIELCYAAETAFVSPILLSLGVPVSLMTLVWCLSPLLGFFLVPILGSVSDGCRSSLGRRRPFILILSAGIILGLILIPNGKRLGTFLGDESDNNRSAEFTQQDAMNISHVENWALIHTSYNLYPGKETSFQKNGGIVDQSYKMSPRHIAGIALTIIGVAMLDFNCDACQSPSRAYLLDISVPEDHAPGLTTFTLMAGLGGCLGYLMGGIDWNAVGVSRQFGGHIQVVFLVVLVAYIICVTLTVTSFKEVPLDELGFNQEEKQKTKKKVAGSKYRKFTNEDDSDSDYADNASNKVAETNDDSESTEGGKMDTTNAITYGTLDLNNKQEIDNIGEHFPKDNTMYNAVENGGKLDTNSAFGEPIEISTDVTLKTYLLSILRMPKSIFILCLTNLFSWMSLVCYSLYFTDFVGQAVFKGEPNAPRGSPSHERYHAGVRLGAFGMSLYSLSCALYSLSIDYLVKKFKAKPVYICSQLVYTVGMVLMAITRNKVAVLILSPSAGIMYATLFTMPYFLVAHYHTNGKFAELKPGGSPSKQVRGLGTDVALVSSMVFLAQFILSLCIGTIVHLAGSTVVVVVTAAILSFCAAITASQVIYLDL